MANGRKKIAIACQGGGTHAAFSAGVLTAVLNDIKTQDRFDLVALSGTSAGALCAMMVWYGLAPKKARQGSGSPEEALESLNSFWDEFAAGTYTEIMHNAFTMAAMRTQDMEFPFLGLTLPSVSLNPDRLVALGTLGWLRQLGGRDSYFDFEPMLNAACDEFDDIDWANVPCRVLLGASQILKGAETVFDSEVSKALATGGQSNLTTPTAPQDWREQLELSLKGVAASGTLPKVLKAQQIGKGEYWDGLYSQNPPIRELLSGLDANERPDEIWVVRINPQERHKTPTTLADIDDRENELMGNLSLNKELDFIVTVNEWIDKYSQMAADHKKVTVRTIKMTKETAERLTASSKFNRSRLFISELREEGERVAQDWLARWSDSAPSYPQDAAY